MENKEISIEEHHAVILEIMEEVDKFCRTNNIPYTLSGGTMLGAVRHGGFIPWDDDADLYMLRRDFDKFAETFKSDKFVPHYLPHDKDGFIAQGYIKITDPNSVISRNGKLGDTGIYIDIFPLDAVPEEPKAQRRHMHKIMRLHNRLYHRHKRNFHSYLKAYWRSVDGWWRKMDKTVHSGKYDDSGLVALATGTRDYKVVVPVEWFDNLKDIEFEGKKFLSFPDPSAYLTKLYGPDFMTPVKWSHGEKAYRR